MEKKMEDLLKEYQDKGVDFVKKYGKLIVFGIVVYIVYKKFIKKA